jgi:hypothetical protein
LSIESHLAVKTSIKLLLYADDTFDTNASGAYDTYANPEQCWANMHTDPSIFPSWLPWEIRRVLYLSLKMFELRFLNEKERSLRALSVLRTGVSYWLNRVVTHLVISASFGSYLWGPGGDRGGHWNYDLGQLNSRLQSLLCFIQHDAELLAAYDTRMPTLYIASNRVSTAHDIVEDGHVEFLAWNRASSPAESAAAGPSAPPPSP